MKKNIAAVAFVVLVVALAAHAQNLEAVLNSMDKAAADFQDCTNGVCLGPVRESR